VMLTVRISMRTDDAPSEFSIQQSPKPLDPSISKRIQNALKQNQLALVFQPISELVGQPDRKSSSKLDIYVMLKDAEGELPASKFIREARASGLIRYIDRWVVHNACALLRAELRKQVSMLLFLRLSRQSLHDPTLVYSLQREVKDHGIAPDTLAFELFESDIADLSEAELKTLREIKGSGFLLSISHFGISREPHQLLQRIPFDFIKLAPALSEKAQHSENACKFIQNVVQVANARGIGVVSTRVSNATAMAAQWNLGVHYVQGNFLQEPEIVMQS
ncbi:MAG: EAL domain-containing protein, partial [Nevskiales bacterium]